jgi:Predicted membrane protein (DUF2232)
MLWIALIGLGAGVTSALLFAAVATGQTFAIALFYLTPLPVVIAGIGWSHLAGAIAALTAAILVGGFFGFWVVFAFLAAIGIPAYLLSYLAMLARSVGNGTGHLEWYPVGRLVLAAALIAAAATAVSIAAFGFDVESYRNGLKAAFERVLRAQLGTPAGQPLELPGTKDTQAVLTLLSILMPPAAACFSMVTLLANLWLGGRIARVSGRLSRPWPDINAMTFPAVAPILLAGSIAATFVPGLIGLVAVFFAATLLLAYAVMGFAVIHGATRGISARIIILVAAWLSVFVLGWPILLVALLGLADTFIDLRGRMSRGGPPDVSPHQPKE